MSAYNASGEDDCIVISIDMYKKLCEDQRFLDALKSAGVDNWDGWDHAIDIFNGYDESTD